jgi:hypothetical protein
MPFHTHTHIHTHTHTHTHTQTHTHASTNSALPQKEGFSETKDPHTHAKKKQKNLKNTEQKIKAPQAHEHEDAPDGVPQGGGGLWEGEISEVYNVVLGLGKLPVGAESPSGDGGGGGGGGGMEEDLWREFEVFSNSRLNFSSCKIEFAHEEIPWNVMTVSQERESATKSG